MTPSPTHLPRWLPLASAAPQPWRNGGGTTRELLAGPHSSEGVVLAQGDDRLALHAGDAPLAFDGADAPQCSLLAGPTQDLNLMLRGGLGDGVGGGMVRANPGQHWHACAAQGGVYSLGPGVLFDDDNGLHWPVPADTLVWFGKVPVRLRLDVPDTTLAFWLAVDLPAEAAA